MNANRRMLAIAAVVAGVVLIAVAIVYFSQPEHSLPSFFPGHTSASSAEANHHHTKHGIAALVVALACFAFAWFQTGPKTSSSDASV
jgi:Na+/H+ antiporter NhaD/arsenite permease-like protein